MSTKIHITATLTQVCIIGNDQQLTLAAHFGKRYNSDDPPSLTYRFYHTTGKSVLS